MPMKTSDFTLEMAKQVCEIINRGNQAEIKRERDKVVIVEIKRKCLSKSDIDNGY